MRIGLFTDTYFPQISGVATSTKTLYEELKRQGHQVTIFTTTDPEVDKDIKKIDEVDVYRFSSIPFGGFKDRRIAFRGFNEVIRIAKKLQLDIVHTQTEFSLGLMGKMVARRMHIPVVHTYHTMYQDYTHYILNGRLINAKGVAVIVKNYLRRINAVIAPSVRVKEVLDSYGVKAPITIVPTGVHVPEVDDIEQKIINVKEKYGLVHEPIVLSLGRVALEKNIDELISSFAIVLEKVPNAKLIIAGDGPAQDELIAHARALGIEQQVIFVGAVEHKDVAIYYRLANVFASASTSETQGLTFVEALSANLPIVAMANDYMTTLIHSKNNGWLVEEDDESIDHLAQAMTYYLENQIKMTADDDIIQATNQDAFANAVIKVYEQAEIEYRSSSNPSKEKIDENEIADDEEFSYAKRLLRPIAFLRSRRK